MARILWEYKILNIRSENYRLDPTYEPQLNLLYVGTGNGSPWPRELRSPGGGDNLFLCSIIALDPD